MADEAKLLDYVLSGIPAILLRTAEEDKGIETCLSVAKSIDKCEVVFWSVTEGFFSIYRDRRTKVADATPQYEKVLKMGIELKENAKKTAERILFVLLDFHPFIKNPIIWRTAKDCFKQAQAEAVTYIFLSKEFDIPLELADEISEYDINLPTKEEHVQSIKQLLEGNPFNPSDKVIEEAAEACLGLTERQAADACSLSLTKHNDLDVKTIWNYKKVQICKDSEFLELYNPEENMDSIGGLSEFKEYILRRRSAFSAEARDYGLPYPKGILLYGVPGCGKSLAAKAMANIWQQPLFKFDLSKLFGSYVGETERNLRKALKMIEAMAPCIAWMDEIDKAIAGTGSSGKTDSGVTSRMFGSLLTWLNEKKSAVYVIATANSINMPTEFTRKGRFDEIFFVDLPHKEERREIFEVLLNKHKGHMDQFDLDVLATNTDGYSGAEIESVIIASMYRAFSEDMRPYNTDDILEELDKSAPASKGAMREQIETIREWSDAHNIRRANGEATNPQAFRRGRVIAARN